MTGGVDAVVRLSVLDLVPVRTDQTTSDEQHIVDSTLQRAMLGPPVEAAGQLRALAQRFEVDEVMVHPVASARRGGDPTTAPGRETTLELLAKELL